MVRSRYLTALMPAALLQPQTSLAIDPVAPVLEEEKVRLVEQAAEPLPATDRSL